MLACDYGSLGTEPIEYTKRTLRVPDLLNEIPSERTIFPKGIVTSLKETNFDSKVGRIELFSRTDNRNGRRYYGILKQLFVAFSSESKILELAGSSSNVIEVHGLQDAKEYNNALVESKLVLKLTREEQEEHQPLHNEEENLREIISFFYGEKTPKLLVSPHWLDLMNFSSGDRVIISNPRENYEIPPPTVA